MFKNSKIDIRKIKANDIDSIVELLQSISDFKPAKTEYSKIWDAFVKQSNVHSLVAIIDEQIVGYGSIVIESKIRGGKMGHIEDIVSHWLFRDKGVGKTILNALFEIAKKNDCYKVALQCKEDNINFYKKCGYEVCGVAMKMFIK